MVYERNLCTLTGLQHFWKCFWFLLFLVLGELHRTRTVSPPPHGLCLHSASHIFGSVSVEASCVAPCSFRIFIIQYQSWLLSSFLQALFQTGAEAEEETWVRYRQECAGAHIRTNSNLVLAQKLCSTSLKSTGFVAKVNKHCLFCTGWGCCLLHFCLWFR